MLVLVMCALAALSTCCSIPNTLPYNVEPVSYSVFNNNPLLFNVSLPAVFESNSILIRVLWKSAFCAQAESNLAGFVPEMYLNINDCPSPQSFLRRNINMTVNMQGDIIQYLAIYPYELSRTNNFVLMIQQGQCQYANFSIDTTPYVDWDMNAQGSDIQIIPAVTRFIRFPVPKSDSIRALQVRYSYDTKDVLRFVESTTVLLHMNAYPKGDATDFSFTENPSFVISPLPTSAQDATLFIALQVDTIQDSISKLLPIKLFVTIGKQCSSGCGIYGSCNFTSGNCICPQNYFGDSCEEFGCIQGEPCDVANGKGIIVCADANTKSCIVTSCNDNTFFRIDTKTNTCKQSFPLDVMLYIVAGVTVLSLVLGFFSGICICSCAKRKKTYYHYTQVK